MSGHTKWSELSKNWSPEHRAEIEALKKRYEAQMKKAEAKAKKSRKQTSRADRPAPE